MTRNTSNNPLWHQSIKSPQILTCLLLPFLLLSTSSAIAQTVTAYQCGLYDKSFQKKRQELQNQKDEEKTACGQKIDQVNNTFAWFKHCEADINDRYRPAFKQLDEQEKQFMDKAQNCTAAADQKIKDQERLAKSQQEAQRRAEQQQQALRTEQFNRELAASNAERDAYNRRAQEDANRQAAQYQAQQRAQQAAAQAEYQRQQAARQAAAEAEQRRQQDWQQTVDITTGWVRSSRESSETALASAHAKTQQIESGYGQEDDALARMLADAKAKQQMAKQAVQTEAQHRGAQTALAGNYSAGGGAGNEQETQAEAETETDSALSTHECRAKAQEVNATRIPANASITASTETVMFMSKTAMDMIDAGCPGVSVTERQQHQEAYTAAQQACNQLQSGDRQCVASNHFSTGAAPGSGLRSPDPKIPVGTVPKTSRKP